MSVRQVFTEIQVVINMSVVKLDCRERTLFIVFILQKHIVLLLVLLYSNKSRPFAVFFVLFVIIIDPRRLIIVTVIKFQAGLDLVCCNRHLRAVE